MSILTPPEHEQNEAVQVAAQWLAEQIPPPRLAVPLLKERFGLTALEACEAIATADRFRTYRRAHG